LVCGGFQIDGEIPTGTGTQEMKKVILCILCASFLNACGGRDPEPIIAIRYGDFKLSCEDIEYELLAIEPELSSRVGKRNKHAKNTALGVAGYFLVVPLFFMDFKNAEKMEYAAYKQRYDHLARIAERKECGAVANRYPTIEELETELKERKEGAKE
jgi:hypothetical protein